MVGCTENNGKIPCWGFGIGSLTPGIGFGRAAPRTSVFIDAVVLSYLLTLPFLSAH